MTKTKTKITKRILCVMLCFVTAFCALPMSASAATSTKFAKCTGLYDETGYYYYYAYNDNTSVARRSYIICAFANTYYRANYTDGGVSNEFYYTCIPSPFSDLNAKTTITKYGPALYYMTVLNSFMKGTSSTKFSPSEYLTVGAALVIMYRMAGSPSVSKQTTFKYISSSSTYYKAAQWAYKNGITTDKSIKPTSTITREKLVTFLYRFYNSLDVTKNYSHRSGCSAINDYSKISSYARTAVRWANYYGFLSLSSNKNFNPSGKITRLNAALMFFNFATSDQDVMGDLYSDYGAKFYCWHKSALGSSYLNSYFSGNKTVYVCKKCQAVYSHLFYDKKSHVNNDTSNLENIIVVTADTAWSPYYLFVTKNQLYKYLSFSYDYFHYYYFYSKTGGYTTVGSIPSWLKE